MPHSVQALVAWFVVSGLSTAGVLYLRATERVSDRLFQPMAAVLCDHGQRLATRYKWIEQAPRREFGDPRELPPRSVAALDVAECVGGAGDRRPATGFLAAVWLAVAAGVGCLVLISARGAARSRRGRRWPGRP